MNIKERINTIKAKRAQIEALLSAKEKEVEEEYQMVMELYNEVNERVEVIKTKQKATEETLDKYDGLLAFLNDDEEITEEPVDEEITEEPVDEEIISNDHNENIDELLKLIDPPTEEPVDEETPTEEKTEVTSNEHSENIDELLKLIDPPTEEKTEVKPDNKWKVAVKKTEVKPDGNVELGEEANNLIDQIGAS